MAIPFLVILKSFICLTATIAASYGLGYLMIRVWGRAGISGFFEKFFFRLLSGALALIVMTACVMTEGKTIHIIFILAALLLWLERKKEASETVEEKNEKAYVLQKLLICFILISFVFTWFLISGKGPEIHAMFYGEVSKCLSKTGYENTFTVSNFINSDYHYPSPYHYSDLWLNVISSAVSGIDEALNLYLITYPFFAFLFLTGLLALAENYGKVGFLQVIGALLCLFLGGLIFSSMIPGFSNHSARMLAPAERCYGAQLLPVCCLSLSAVLLWIKEKKSQALICFMLIPVISIVILPAMTGGLGIYFVYRWISCNRERKFWLRMLFYGIVICGSILLFYSVLTENNLNYRKDKALLEYSDWKGWHFSSMKFFLGEIISKAWAVPFLLVLNYLPCLALLFLFHRFPFRGIFLPIALICFSGLAASQILYKLEDSHELFINTLVLFHTFLCVAFMFTLSIQIFKPWLKWTPLSVAGIACLINAAYVFNLYKHHPGEQRQFSQAYVRQIREEIKNNESIQLGGLIFSRPPITISDTLSAEFGLLHESYYHFPPIQAKNVFVPFNLNAVKGLKNAYSKFISEKSRDYPLLSSEQLTELFIREFKLAYLITYDEYGPMIGKLKVKKIIRDDLSGQKFILLDTN